MKKLLKPHIVNSHFSFIAFSSLFPDVVNCMQTDNLELKKLVYLYLMNYAKSQPDMAIMAVNSFVKASSKTDFTAGRNTVRKSETLITATLKTEKCFTPLPH